MLTHFVLICRVLEQGPNLLDAKHPGPEVVVDQSPLLGRSLQAGLSLQPGQSHLGDQEGLKKRL